MTELLENLTNNLSQHHRAVLLFSGGLDSSLLLAVAARTLGPGFCALTFAGPHIAPGELAAAWALARRLKVRHLVRSVDPLALPDFRGNTPRRCYACKRAIITRAWEVARAQGAEVLWDGTNLDDLGDFRPGLQAARELGVASPLLEAGLNKAAIRALSRALGLPWQKPAQSCLATRFPYGTPLTRGALERVGQGEAWLRRRGFSHVRLRRPAAGVARLELNPEEWPAFLAPEVRGPFTALASRLGIDRLALDLPR
ncbi:MAG: ATP-dependent sacrificial sulfur transferase LarE [Deltaproteobacteria bacterium]|nr:ATP-dependent sacrificial sulfur transferase LarE [Deltaproteobacteria bacterium]